LNSSQLLNQIAVAEKCKIAVLQHKSTKARTWFKGFTQLGLHFDHQGMMTVLALCKPTDCRALLFALFVALFIIFQW